MLPFKAIVITIITTIIIIILVDWSYPQPRPNHQEQEQRQQKNRFHSYAIALKSVNDTFSMLAGHPLHLRLLHTTPPHPKKGDPPVRPKADPLCPFHLLWKYPCHWQTVAQSCFIRATSTCIEDYALRKILLIGTPIRKRHFLLRFYIYGILLHCTLLFYFSLTIKILFSQCTQTIGGGVRGV